MAYYPGNATPLTKGNWIRVRQFITVCVDIAYKQRERERDLFTYTYIYIYIHRKRERERERDREREREQGRPFHFRSGISGSWEQQACAGYSWFNFSMSKLDMRLRVQDMGHGAGGIRRV